MLAIRRILHPTDFSERSQAAFQMACSLARQHGVRLIILHVMTPPATVFGELTARAEQSVRESEARTLAQLKPSDPQVRFEHQLEEGDPVEQILHAAKVNQCDLIVMGTHGRTGLGRLLMGSVAEQVLRKADCPVLTVKAPFPAEESQAMVLEAGQVVF